MKEKKTVRKPKIEISLTEDEKEIINNFAAKENLKPATFCRKVILDYINSKKS